MSAGRVLVVDDEPEVRLVLTEFLESRGFQVTAAESGAGALAVVDSVEPHVVLLDVTMPEMDGIETLKRLAALKPGLPIIMVSANADVDITSKSPAMGAADYIPKPFDLDYLGQAVSIQVSAALDLWSSLCRVGPSWLWGGAPHSTKFPCSVPPSAPGRTRSTMPASCAAPRACP